jgi:hypothetical protein
MGSLEKVLSLRPTTAALRLGPQSRVALLDPTDLLREIGPQEGAFLTIPVTRPGACAGLVRAARDAGAPLGLRCPHPFVERGAPHALFEAVRAAAEELRCGTPLFLEGGPVRLAAESETAVERAAADVHAYVDAGFGLVSLDVSAVAPESAGALCLRVGASAWERELSVEIAAPVREQRVEVAALEALFHGLRVRVAFVSVDSAALGVQLPGAGQWALDVPLLESVRQIAEEHGAALCVAERGGHGAAAEEAWVDAGVRKIIAYDTFEKLERLPEDRWEALSYCETTDLLERTRTSGMARRLLAGLAARADD